ncbi:hypothetical protein, partial [Klebsiella pneumoniae]|uniref:hypothetical protein n=1 Tax=Klebsiella pneumoniae TaxID=573 RepID=UPI001D0E9765
CMVNHLDFLAFQFFKLFAQYEYALKAMGYAKSGRDDSVQLDWDGFSNDIGCLVLVDAEFPLQHAIDYIFDEPPRKQVLEDGKINWRKVNADQRSPQILFSHIRRVRNNLYHGGKFNAHWLQPERSDLLVKNSLIVLRALQGKHDGLAEAIRENRAS